MWWKWWAFLLSTCCTDQGSDAVSKRWPAAHRTQPAWLHPAQDSQVLTASVLKLCGFASSYTQLWKCMHVSYGLCSTRLVAWRVIILTVQKRSVLHLKTLPVILQQSCSPTSMTCLSPNCQGRERQQAARWVWLVSSACQYHPWIVFHGDVCPCILFTGLLCLVDHVSSWSGPFLPCLCQCALLSKWKTL